MLSPSCDRFRSLYEPHGDVDRELDAHRRSCPDCAAWAERLEAFTGGEAKSPLPASLRRRLLAIPEERVSCRDVERLYEATWQRAWNGEADDADVADHLAGCARCRALYGTLGASFRVPRRAMPHALFQRLRAIVERPRLPLVVRDSRLAVAASALLAASLTLFMGDPTALFRSTAATLSSQAAVLAEEGAERRQAILEVLSDQIGTRYERGREMLAAYGQPYEELWHEARDYYENQDWRQLLESLTPEGESDGDP